MSTQSKLNRKLAVSGAYVVMGVSGSGKSTVASALAAQTGGFFIDGDDFHSVANKSKMAAGIPLTDSDRWPWLMVLNEKLKEQNDRPIFLACSALRQTYRDRLAAGIPSLRFIYLRGSKEFIRRRLEKRQGHFMPPALLDSQFATLEEPQNAIVVSAEEPLRRIVDAVLREIGAERVRSNGCATD